MTDNGLDQNYLKTLTVLYVEDDNDTREQFSEYLRHPVGTLITAGNGAEGLEAFIKYAPDIVITDILMPLMDGLTMSCEIRGRNSQVPIIVLTAFEQAGYMMRAIDIGVHKYVTKPVNISLLLKCMHECAHRLRADEQLRFVHQQEVQALQSKHHEAVVTLAGGLGH
ncbi:MAG: response regulator transcription factor [Desulfuromonadaceae bacterium]